MKSKEGEKRVPIRTNRVSQIICILDFFALALGIIRGPWAPVIKIKIKFRL